jgi:GNAT superfamily N-acetyltransferase
MSNIVVRKVDNPADFKLFFEFPWKHYANDPHWVPQLVSQRRDLLDKKRNPAWDYMEGDYFIALKDGDMVGTIAAVINHHHNSHNQEHMGFFGMFECINDQAVANALLDTVVNWVKTRGFDAIRGPQNFTTHEECGLLIDNFTQPMVLMPYNPQYYQALLENYGFKKAMDVYSVYQDRPIVERNKTLERFGKIAEHMTKRTGIVIRQLDPKKKTAEFELYKKIYNDAWTVNWGFHPFTSRELDVLVESLGMFVDPALTFFAEHEGRPVGFAMAIPNMNEALAFARPKPGTPELWTLLKVLYHWKIAKKISSVRLPLMGVLPEYRNKGVDVAFMYHVLKAVLPTQYQFLDAGWILETNELMHIISKVEGKPYKTHRFYQIDFKPVE